MKSSEGHWLSAVTACSCQRAVLRRPACGIVRFLLIAVLWLSGGRVRAQSTPDKSDTINGIVINSVTREPIARALVSSPDSRFATLTNSEGRFEFTLPKVEPAVEGGLVSNMGVRSRLGSGGSDRPYTLMARKPGFLTDPRSPQTNLSNETAKDLTLTLIPEALIVGTVTLPTAEAPDSIGLQIYRRQVQEGRGRWFQVGNARSTSDGQFRFADLEAGTYKLLTEELLDRDPLTFDPGGSLYGYPPVYYQSAPDFGSASTIRLAAGQTVQMNLSLVKHPYYRVRVPVIGAGDGGMNVSVFAGAQKSPGFSLAYNNDNRAIEGMLPNGTYTVEATSFGPEGMTGTQTITVKGGPFEGPGMALTRNAPIPVSVKEEFTSVDTTGTVTWNINGRNQTIKGPRRYLNVMLEPANDFGVRGVVSLRPPSGPSDDKLVIEGAPSGGYWVRVSSSRGYAASIRSGNLDLQRQPLVVEGAVSPIEITMRDDTAEISGTVEGVPKRAQDPSSMRGQVGGGTFYRPDTAQPGARIYCIPLPDSTGQFVQIYANSDGTFTSPALAPGAYRLLAFDREQPELEYLNPEAIQGYDSKGPVVHLVGGQKERVQLQLISTKEE